MLRNARLPDTPRSTTGLNRFDQTLRVSVTELSARMQLLFKDAAQLSTSASLSDIITSTNEIISRLGVLGRYTPNAGVASVEIQTILEYVVAQVQQYATAVLNDSVVEAAAADALQQAGFLIHVVEAALAGTVSSTTLDYEIGRAHV